MPIEQIKGKNVEWINITYPRDINSPEIAFLKKKFHFNPVNIQDAISNGQRPKIDIYDDHIFLVLLYPLYNRKSGEILAAEIDFYISKNTIILIHDNKLPTIVRFFNHLKKEKHRAERDNFLAQNVMAILYNLLQKLTDHDLPMLDHISLDIHKTERNIFRGKEKEMVGKILASRRNIVNFRKSMQAHKNILKKLEQANNKIKFVNPNTANIYFNSLIDKVKEIWDTLESFKESIEALNDTNESLISFRLNNIMKTFTIISVIIFILTLIATLLNLKVSSTPFVNWPLAFWVIVIVETIIALVIFNFFKRKKWLE